MFGNKKLSIGIIVFLIIVLLCNEALKSNKEKFGSTDWADQWRSLNALSNVGVQYFTDNNGFIHPIFVRIPNDKFVPMVSSF
jgi:hypothetical protein